MKYLKFNNIEENMDTKNGKKYDDGKLRYDLVPVGAHEGLAEVFTYGATKYGDNNWQQVEADRYTAALFRHVNAWRKGQRYDLESRLHHLKHAMANIAILLWKEESKLALELEEMYNDYKDNNVLKTNKTGENV